jgi:hypothetical protein
MNTRHSILRCLVAALAISWATGALAADDDQIYFVQQSFYAYKDKYDTTNYHVGTLIPINTRAKITDMGSRQMEIELPDKDNMEIAIVNVEKHTHKNMEEIKARMFGTAEVKLNKFPQDVQDAIKNGQIKVGMTKEQVLLAYGYPPAHVTPSTDSNEWTYWKNRWNRIVLDFQGDKLAGIRD